MLQKVNLIVDHIIKTLLMEGIVQDYYLYKGWRSQTVYINY